MRVCKWRRFGGAELGIGRRLGEGTCFGYGEMAGGFEGASGELRREYVFLTLINYWRSGFCRYMQGADVAVRGCGLVGDRARVRVSMLRDGLRVRREYVFEG